MQFSFFEKEKSTDWKWTMKNDYPKKNGLKVFSCFACGGGSTMGYKLAGCDVLGCNEIDTRMNKVYVENHHPKYNYLEDIRDFNKRKDLPEELYNLDILDGSPPCSTFSMAGQREDAWGKEKKFREGQKLQTLDDLLFVFIDTVNKLKPKVAIMENVEGLMLGNAWSYVQEIYKKFNAIGYKVKHWLLKGENMGIPQTRHRVFFIATRLDFDLNKIDLGFDYEPVVYGDIKSGNGREINKETQTYKYLNEYATHNDLRLCDIFERLGQKPKCFGLKIAWEENILQTLTAKLDYVRGKEKTTISLQDIIHAQTFPEDYIFDEYKWANISYFCGMSVPPVMIKRIVLRLIESGIFR
jgi:DNA (cytosine-5)-methyltransferase 1